MSATSDRSTPGAPGGRAAHAAPRAVGRSTSPVRGIPEATVARLPVYLRALVALTERGIATCSSEELATAAGGTSCARVDADTVRAATGFPIGGVPPFGHATELAVFVDPDLLAYDEVWAAAGTWHDVFALSPADLVRVSGGTVVDLKR